MGARFVPGLVAPADPGEGGPAWWFLFDGAEILVRDEPAPLPSVPRGIHPSDFGAIVVRDIYLGTLEGAACFAAALSPEGAPAEGFARYGLRALYGRVDEETAAVAGRAFQLLEWDRANRFCGACGSATLPAAGERARVCPNCEAMYFPRLSPVVIVRVDRDRQMLLAHARGFPEGIYSVLAGFVEPGETLEEAVAREVREEVGLEVDDIRYFRSQPWPFPHSLMIGFTARHAGGDIRVDGEEIEDAGWFSPDGVPGLAPGFSIARWLIDAFPER
jgi:NAD+ diphosphatase